MSTDCDGSVSIATSGQANLGRMTANGDNVRAFAHRMGSTSMPKEFRHFRPGSVLISAA